MFPATQWTLILQSGDDLTALDQLCRRYWAPLRDYARQRGFADADAEDITQSFFARLLEQRTHTKADPARGRFRTFLLSAMQHFIANHHRDATRQKRGGGSAHDDIEDHAHHLADQETPERIFERRWAESVIAAGITALEAEHQSKGQMERFTVFRPLLSVRHDGDTDALAAQLNVSTANFRKLLHLFRRRFGDLVREEVRSLVSDESEVDDELMYLMRSLEN
jgi:RNA polymerase sigma factor (sigma-70 family)